MLRQTILRRSAIRRYIPGDADAEAIWSPSDGPETSDTYSQDFLGAGVLPQGAAQSILDGQLCPHRS